MRRSRRTVECALLGLTCLSGQLLAEEQAGSTFHFDPVGYFGARVGYVELEEVDDDGSFNFGVMGGVFFFSHLAAEASIDFQVSDFEFEFTDGTTITFPEIERKTIALQAGLSFMPFPEYQVRPYVLGGFGYYRSRYTSSDLPRESVSDSGYFTGLGVDLLGGQWNGDGSLVVEARWLFTQKEQYAEQSVRSDGFTVTVGFRIKTM